METITYDQYKALYETVAQERDDVRFLLEIQEHKKAALRQQLADAQAEIKRLRDAAKLVIEDCEAVGMEPFHLNALRIKLAEREAQS